MVEAGLLAMGLKPLAVVAGFFGGLIAAGLLPGPLRVLAHCAVRLPVGALCGAVIAGYGAQPLAEALGHPESVGLAALCVGVGGLSFFFKVLEAWNQLDLGAVLVKLIEKFTGRSSS